MRWIDLGPISNCNYSTPGGVYLLVHRGKYNRVIYVGTSSYIAERCRQHYIGFLSGHRTIWRVTSDDDVYAFMSSWGLRNYITYFRKLARAKKLWASTTLDKNLPENLLLRPDSFDQDWKDWLHQQYLPRISVWALEFKNYDAQACMKIESAIQQRLVDAFKLGRFFNHKDYSILGKVEFNSSFQRLKLPFSNTPNLDEASKLIFESITDKKIPDRAIQLAGEQLSDVIRERNIARSERWKAIKARRARHTNHGKPWTRMDAEKLRVMLVEFDMNSKEIASYLSRTTKAVQIQIERNDKLSNRRWRSSIEFLDFRVES